MGLLHEPRMPQDGRRVVLRLAGIQKTFGGTAALREAGIEVRSGEIHAVVGGNGSGKSTMIKILAGVYSADSGTIEVEGKTWPAAAFTPALAKTAGLHFVHQALGVFPDLSVAENLMIGRGYEMRRGRAIAWPAVRARAATLMDRFHIDADPDSLVADLGPAEQALVAIARALQDQDDATRGILVLDEPTAALPAPEVETLLAALRRYAASGQTIVFVSHRLDEVFALADRVTVLRDGRPAGSAVISQIDKRALMGMMFAPGAERPALKRRAWDGEVTLELSGLSVGPLAGVSLRLRRGEILGIAGLLGSGRSELLKAMFGLLPHDGEMLMDGKPVRIRSPKQAMRLGIALVPEDRIQDAAFADMSVRENLTAGFVARYWRQGRMCHGDERVQARALIKRFGIVPHDEDGIFGLLSGGNQQKAVLARWLSAEPRVLLLDEPTQGVDVAARAEIHHLIRGVVADRNSALVVSSDFDELAELADRVIVLGQGCIAGEVDAEDLSAEQLTALCYQSLETS